tara:strand:+ start:332 stop:853 length:522 start_codon:yes stop_codon:yes gene_type:complete
MNSTTIKRCLECKDELVVPTNWYPSFPDKGYYKCKPCVDSLRIINHIKAGTASSRMIAKHLGAKALGVFDHVTAGYVYIISNPAWKDWKKVGMAIDAYDRCGAFQTSSPLRDYRVEYCKHFEDRREAEKGIHTILDEQGIERVGEWFKSHTSTLKQVIQAYTGEKDDTINSSI